VGVVNERLANLPALTAAELDVLAHALALAMEASYIEGAVARRAVIRSLQTAVAEARYTVE
jgi:hypothetical protein